MPFAKVSALAVGLTSLLTWRSLSLYGPGIQGRAAIGQNSNLTKVA
jgi:hypothetical protein